MFVGSRSGARNATGIAFQVNCTVFLLLRGIEGSTVVQAVPEGDEDIDLILDDGECLTAQVKFRSTGALGRRDLAKAIVKAWLAGRTRSPAQAHAVILSNADDFAGLGATGWQGTIATSEAAGKPDLDRLADALQHVLDELAVGSVAVQEVLASTSLVTLNLDTDSLQEAVRDRLPSLSPMQASFSSALLVARAFDAIDINRTADRRSAATLDQQAVARVLDESALVQGSWIAEIEAKRRLVPTDFWSAPAEDRETFLRGIHASPGHIAAGYAVERSEDLFVMSKSIHNGRGSFIVGPSGSGKSTLLWQAATSAIRTMSCYTLTSAHSLEVPALLKQIALLATRPMLICVDEFQLVHFSGWNDLVRGLETTPNVRILVACREEEFRPALLGKFLVATRSALSLADASGIVQDLAPNRFSPSEIARLYEESGGLMMELVHLATTNRRLANVLGAQADQMLNMPDQLPAQIARMILTAHLCGLQLDTRDLRGMCQSDIEFSRALQYLVNEHVVLSENGQTSGLHILRSRELVRGLHATFPPLVSTIEALVPYAAQEALGSLGRLWFGAGGSRDVFIGLVSAWLRRQRRIDWAAVAETGLVLEAVAYAVDFKRSLPQGELAAGPSLMLAVGNGGLFDGWLYDLQEVPMDDPRMKQRAMRMSQVAHLFESLPHPPKFRKELIASLRGEGPLDTRHLTLSSLAMLRGTDCFETTELASFCARVVSAAELADPDIDYGGWESHTARTRMSRAWAAKAAAEVARLGPNAAAALDAVLPPEKASRAAWMLSAKLQLVRVENLTEPKRAVAVVPHSQLDGEQRRLFLTEALDDACAVSDVSSLSLSLVFPDGSPFIFSGEPPGDQQFVGRADRVNNPLVGMVYLDEYRRLSRSISWFNWLDAVANILEDSASVLEDAVSASLVQMQTNGPANAAISSIRALSSEIERIERRLEEPPEAPIAAMSHSDNLDRLAFGLWMNRQSGWILGDQGSIAALSLKVAVLSTIGEARRVIEFYLSGRTKQADRQWTMRNRESAMTIQMLLHVQSELERLMGTRAELVVGRIAACAYALRAVTSVDDVASEFSGERLRHGIAVSRSAPQKAVERLVARVADRSASRLRRESEAADDLLGALGVGWVAVSIDGEGQLWGSVAPRWVFIGPPSWWQGSPELVRALSAAPWAWGRSLIATRRLDGSIRLLASLVPNDLLSLPGVEPQIVNQYLEKEDPRFADRPTHHDLGGALGQLLVLLDVVSREFCAVNLSGTKRRELDPTDLRALGWLMPAESNELIEAIESQSGEVEGLGLTPSLAQRLSDKSFGDEDRLIYLTLQCQKTIALSKLSAEDAHFLLLRHPD